VVGLPLALLVAGEPTAAASSEPSRVATDQPSPPAAKLPGGELTIDLERAPVETVVEVIRLEAGVRVLLPPSLRGALVSLHALRRPLDEVVRRLIDALELEGYALVYDARMRPERLIVVAPRRRDRTESAPGTGTGPGTDETTAPDQVLRDLEQAGTLGPEERKRIWERLHTPGDPAAPRHEE
jgi:hypothetical protein